MGMLLLLLVGDVDEDAFFGDEDIEVEEVVEVRAFGIERGGFKGDVIAR